MTGEITLRGMVLPVGGLKEKILAARRAEIKTVIVPEANRKDLEDLPRNVRNSINFIFVKQMGGVIEIGLVGGENKRMGALPGVSLVGTPQRTQDEKWQKRVGWKLR